MSDLETLRELRDSLNKENKKSMNKPIFLDVNGLTTTSASISRIWLGTW